MTASPDRRRRVVQVVTRFQAGAGGVALRGALALDPDRYVGTVVTGSGDHLLDQARDGGLGVVVMPELRPEIAPRHDRQALARLTEVLAGLRPDVVHTHSAKAGALGRMAARRAGVPRVVHTYHGFPFHEFQSPPRRAAYVAVERHLAKITDAFLAVGTAVAAEAVRRRIADPSRIRTINVAVDEPTATVPGRADARDALGLDLDVPVVGSVGRLDYQKAPEHLVEALARLSCQQALLVVVGDGPLRDRVALRARRLGVEHRVRLLGARTDVPNLLPAFDVFAMASRYEGLPCAVVEAMGAGVPVVATAVNAVPDVVQPGQTGLLVPPAQPAALAGAIDWMLAHPSAAARMAARAHDQLGSRFAADTLGEVLDEAYAGEGAR